MNNYLDLVTDYFFSSKKLQDYSDCQQQTLQLAIFIITTHGVGGKFVESLIKKMYNLQDSSGIHGWDAFKPIGKKFRPVEIKTETINNSKVLNCEGSFAEHRENTLTKKELFLNERPLLYSVGVSNVDGKCLYVMETDTEKMEQGSLLFERLSAKSPRISFNHWKEDQSVYTVLYKNDDHISKNATEFNKDLLECLSRVQ